MAWSDHTFVGVASIIAAVASLVSAIASVLNSYRLRKVQSDVDVVKKNGHGEGGTA